MKVDKFSHLDNPLFGKNNHDKVILEIKIDSASYLKQTFLILENDPIFSGIDTEFNIRLYYLNLQYF